MRRRISRILWLLSVLLRNHDTYKKPAAAQPFEQVEYQLRHIEIHSHTPQPFPTNPTRLDIDTCPLKEQSSAKMLPRTKAVQLALLLAYRALAAPINHSQQGQVQSVISAIKAQAGNELYSPIIDHVEGSLRANGVLGDKNTAALNQKIEVSRCLERLGTLLDTCHLRTTYRSLTENRHRRSWLKVASTLTKSPHRRWTTSNQMELLRGVAAMTRQVS